MRYVLHYYNKVVIILLYIRGNINCAREVFRETETRRGRTCQISAVYLIYLSICSLNGGQKNADIFVFLFSSSIAGRVNGGDFTLLYYYYYYYYYRDGIVTRNSVCPYIECGGGMPRQYNMSECANTPREGLSYIILVYNMFN